VEKANTELSRKRAEAVRDYLKNAWGISDIRFRVKVQNLPDKVSSLTDPNGVVENRRVELYSSEPSVLDPVETGDTLRTVTPPMLRFTPSVQADAGLTHWNVSATQNGLALKEFEGKSSIPKALEWNIEREHSTIPLNNEPVRYSLTVTDATKHIITTPVSEIPVEQITVRFKTARQKADKKIDKYNLILFDFDSPDLSPHNQRIAGIIREKLATDASVAITGYTDRIGEAEYNQRLSEERAKATARAINKPSAVILGKGPSDKFDNNLPEGRFYNRTVEIYVETPLNQ
jgi:outer membrane protein OmpA-like peptidoglycan-associated protein